MITCYALLGLAVHPRGVKEQNVQAHAAQIFSVMVGIIAGQIRNAVERSAVIMVVATHATAMATAIACQIQ